MKKHETVKRSNPFTPSFGSVPPSLAGREEIIDDVLSGLNNGVGDPNRASILSGARGTGKTVLLTTISNDAESQGWVSVNVTSGDGLLNEIIIQIRDKASHILSKKKKKKLEGLQVGPLGFTIDNLEKKTSWRSEITKVIQELNEKNVGLFITVDEISQNDEELKTLIDAFQHFVREGRDVAILMAGLPHNISMLLQEKNSFLRRAYQHSLNAISVDEVAYAIKETVEQGGRIISIDALNKAAESTNGFAFFIQLLGYHMWRQSPDEMEITAKDVEGAIIFAKRDMRRMVLDSTYYELTDREKQFVEAMAADDRESRISEIAERMGIEKNNASQIKKRLTERGVIYETGRGKVAYVIPLLREYLLDL